LLHAEKTELDPQFESMLARADRAEDQTRKLLSALEAYLQPNPGFCLLKFNDIFNNLFSTSSRRCSNGKIGLERPRQSAFDEQRSTANQFGTFGCDYAGSGANIRDRNWLWELSGKSGPNPNEVGRGRKGNGPNNDQSNFGTNSTFFGGRYEEYSG
jgi:hypothetical protein